MDQRRVKVYIMYRYDYPPNSDRPENSLWSEDRNLPPLGHGRVCMLGWYIIFWLVVSNMHCFSPILGMIGLIYSRHVN